MENLIEKIKTVRTSIIAIGFRPNPNQLTILGSGFSVDKNGKILSAAHLYNGLSDEAKTQLIGIAMVRQDLGGLQYYEGFPLKLVKKDDQLDLALFQLEKSNKTLLSPLKIGNVDKIQVGQPTYFIGFPYASQLMNEGYGITLIVNHGIISSVKRKGNDPTFPLDWFFVDAVSNPGNSGCPLIDSETNEVIGVMLTSFRTPSKINPQLDIKEPMHIAGARPINLAKELLKEL